MLRCNGLVYCCIFSGIQFRIKEEFLPDLQNYFKTPKLPDLDSPKDFCDYVNQDRDSGGGPGGGDDGFDDYNVNYNDEEVTENNDNTEDISGTDGPEGNRKIKVPKKDLIKQSRLGTDGLPAIIGGHYFH